ncbi:MAG: hypothetical protein Q8859_12175 [Bacteroidota bacterium]|nr:hypothetical protein [Bacteroidota bacterium]
MTSALNNDEQYNGSISGTCWSVNDQVHGYGYQYDDLYRLKAAEYGAKTTDCRSFLNN